MARTLFWGVAFCLALISSGTTAKKHGPPDGFDPRRPEEVPGLFQGDIRLDGFGPYNAIGDIKKRWPSTKIPVFIHSYFDKYDMRVFNEAMHEIEEQTRVDGKDCITFVNRTKETGYIYLTAGYGCSSNVGFMGVPQSMTLGPLCRFKGTVIHEFLHSLGFYHEQNRPDRDDYVKIIEKNVKPGHLRNFVKVLPPLISTQGLPYDYNSLTHYGNTTFSVDGKKLTIVPLKKGVSIGQREGMSQLDIIQLQRLYGCKERKVIKPQTPGMVTPNCTFDSDFCGWTHVEILPPLKNNTWTRWRGESVNYRTGPVVDHTIKTFEGYYIFVNSFRNYHSVAKIRSPKISPGTYCLSFWYHMHGRDMGSLTVNLVRNGITWKIQSLKGEQGNEWKEMRVLVQAPEGGQIEFEGIAGSMYRSDLAVDDVTLFPGEC